MPRFIQLSDYDMQIRAEIRRLLDSGAPTDTVQTAKLMRAEDTAIEQMIQWLGAQYDTTTIFAPWDGTGTDSRNAYIVTTAIDITLYHIYSQSNMKDIPSHREHRYEDALSWLKAAGTGRVNATLPRQADDDNPGDIRIWSKPPECYDY